MDTVALHNNPVLCCNLSFVFCSIYKVHDEAKDKAFELEMSWVCDESKRQHEKVISHSTFFGQIRSHFSGIVSFIHCQGPLNWIFSMEVETQSGRKFMTLIFRKFGAHVSVNASSFMFIQFWPLCGELVARHHWQCSCFACLDCRSLAHPTDTDATWCGRNARSTK